MSLAQKLFLKQVFILGDRHSSVVSSAPTIMWLQVRIPTAPSTLFQFVMRKGRKNKKRPGFKKTSFQVFFLSSWKKERKKERKNEWWKAEMRKNVESWNPKNWPLNFCHKNWSSIQSKANVWGTPGRVVDFDTRGLRFKSRYWQVFWYVIFVLSIKITVTIGVYVPIKKLTSGFKLQISGVGSDQSKVVAVTHNTEQSGWFRHQRSAVQIQALASLRPYCQLCNRHSHP